MCVHSAAADPDSGPLDGVTLTGHFGTSTALNGYDDARGIVLYFLSNAGSRRGEVAKRVKAELRGMLAGGK